MVKQIVKEGTRILPRISKIITITKSKDKTLVRPNYLVLRLDSGGFPRSLMLFIENWYDFTKHRDD